MPGRILRLSIFQSTQANGECACVPPKPEGFGRVSAIVIYTESKYTNRADLVDQPNPAQQRVN